jgi:hypothetical protein
VATVGAVSLATLLWPRPVQAPTAPAQERYPVATGVDPDTLPLTDDSREQQAAFLDDRRPAAASMAIPAEPSAEPAITEPVAAAKITHSDTTLPDPSELGIAPPPAPPARLPHEPQIWSEKDTARASAAGPAEIEKAPAPEQPLRLTQSEWATETAAPPEEPTVQAALATLSAPAPADGEITPSPKPVARPAPGPPVGWAAYRNLRFKFSLKYPAAVFTAAKPDADPNATVLVSQDGRASLRLWAAQNAHRATLASYRRRVMETRYANATFDYAPVRDFWFVLSGTLGDAMFYERVTYACDRKAIHSWQLNYPLSERSLYDPIVEAMHRSYQNGNGPGARCGSANAAMAKAGGETEPTSPSIGALQERYDNPPQF